MGFCIPDKIFLQIKVICKNPNNPKIYSKVINSFVTILQNALNIFLSADF